MLTLESTTPQITGCPVSAARLNGTNRCRLLTLPASPLLFAALMVPHPAHAADPRIREVWYDPQAVVSVNAKRGVVTTIEFDPTENIVEVASGLGSDCAKADATWCVAAQPGGRYLFIKPKSGASGSNNVTVVTNQHAHVFRFNVLAEGDGQPIFRLTVHDARPSALTAPSGVAGIPASTAPVRINGLDNATLLAERLAQPLRPVNGDYSIAEGPRSGDIVPTLVFDDGHFTYFRFPANREVPAVFQVLADGGETLVNARMEEDLLVADRVSRHLVLRAGSAVVSVKNEAFDLDGVPPTNGSNAVGVQRLLRAAATAAVRQGDAP